MKSETYELNKTLVLSALDSIAAWEQWATILPDGAKKTLNLSLIRLTKGLVKAWRIFLSDTGATKQLDAGSRSIPASFADYKGGSNNGKARGH